MLFERQIRFYFRILFLDSSRWVKQALLDHLSGSWKSPYLAHINAVRSELGIFDAPFEAVVWKRLCYNYFLSVTNTTISHVPWLEPLERFSRLPYVCESKWSTVISQFRVGNEGLGNKQPRTGYQRKPLCPVCPNRQPNDGHHLLFECSSLSTLRAETGITSFINLCVLKGIASREAYALFITGQDSQRNQVGLSDFFERGKSIYEMRELWLSKW